MDAMAMVMSYLTWVTTEFFIRGQCKPNFFIFLDILFVTFMHSVQQIWGYFGDGQKNHFITNRPFGLT